MSELNREEISFISSYFDESVEAGPVSLYGDLKYVEGRYEQRELIASGGMKEVYRCVDRATDREVAKAVLIDTTRKEAVEDFLREARITARLQHPNIIPVYDIAKDEQDSPFFTMKIVEGQTLTQYRRRIQVPQIQKESWAELLTLFLRVLEAVAYAHSKGVLHLDLKPDNIQVSQYGEVLVCDWGLARIKGESIPDDGMANYMLHETMGENLTLNGYIKGSPGYIAPEQIDAKLGEKDELTDVFSLGCVMYDLITGKAAVERDNFEEYLTALKKSDYRLPSKLLDVPEGLEAICLKAMSFDKGDRYAKVQDMIDDVQAYLLGFAPSAENAGLLKQSQLFYQRNRKACHTATVFMGALFASGFFYMQEIKLSRRATELALVEVQKTNDEKSELITWYKNGIMDSAMAAYKKKNYVTALNILKDLHFVSAIRLKLDIYIIRKHLEQAYELAQASDSKTYLQRVEYLRSFKTEEGFFDMERMIMAKHPNFMSEKLMHLIYENHLTVTTDQAERLTLVPLLIKRYNHIHELNFYFEYQEDGIHVDLSHNPRLRRSNWINHLGLVSSLDVSNTSLNNVRGFNQLPLVKLNLSHTAVDSLAYLGGMNLKELYLDYTYVTGLQPLKNMHTLKELTLPEKFPETQLSYLPKGVRGKFMPIK